VSFALYICALIVGIEYLIRVFPSAEDKGSIPEDTPPDRSFIPLVSIPLANIGQPTPRPDPSIIPKFSKRVEPPRIHRRTVRRVRSAADTTDSYNATKPIYNNGTEPSPDSNSTPPSGAITDEEKLLIDWAERTGKPITFGGRAAYSPFIYGNESTPGNGTAPQLQRRHQAPSRYAQLSGPVQIVVPMVYVWYSDDGVPVEGTSTIVYVGTEEVTDEPYCYAICDGSAIVFRELDCWQWWVKSALYEADSRAGNGSAVWLVQEQLQLGATSCQVRPGVAEPDLPEDGTPGRTPVGVGLPPKPPARVVVETLKDADGRPTATQTMFISTLPPMISTATLLDSKGAPTATVTIGPTPRPTRIVTLTDSRGLPSITLTWSPPLTTLTLRDLQGRATATLTVDASPTSPPFITLSNSLGNPTATIPIAIPTRSVPPKYTDQNPLQSQHHPLSSLEYSLAVFLPLLLCAPLAILSQIVSSDLKALLPFHALAASKDGSLANHSLLLSTGGIYGVLSGFRLLFQQGEGLSLLSDGLIVTSAVVTALASEAVGVVLRGRCAANDFSGCYLGVAVFGKASRAVQVGLSVLLVVVVLMGMLLVRWKTGVGEGPLSLAMTASLARDEEVRGLLQRVEVDCGDDGGEVIGRRELEKVFGRRRFVLGCAGGEKEDQTYGIVIKSEPEAESKLSYDIGYDLGKGREQRKPWLPRCLTRQPTTDVVTLCGTTLLCGLLALVLYYETTQADSGFEDFMNDQNFGARILFAGLGVVISLFWGEYYSSKSHISLGPPSLCWTGIG